MANMWRYWRRSGVVIFIFEHISYLFLMFFTEHTESLCTAAARSPHLSPVSRRVLLLHQKSKTAEGIAGFSILSMPNCNDSKNINSSKIFSKDFKVPWKLSRPIFCYGCNLGQRVYCRNPPISKNHLSLKLKISYLNGLHG